jgi:hypothetical protein
MEIIRVVKQPSQTARKGFANRRFSASRHSHKDDHHFLPNPSGRYVKLTRQTALLAG